jgi:hypothetical protein
MINGRSLSESSTAGERLEDTRAGYRNARGIFDKCKAP